jgi:hypothetical protein
MAGVRTCVYEGWLSSDPNPSQVPAGFWSARSRARGAVSWAVPTASVG